MRWNVWWIFVILACSTAHAEGPAAFPQTERNKMIQERTETAKELGELFPGIRSLVLLPADERGRVEVRPVTASPADACGSQDECTDATDTACGDAGFGGVKDETVLITVQEDGGMNCSGDCTDGCNENGCPVAMIACDPA